MKRLIINVGDASYEIKKDDNFSILDYSINEHIRSVIKKIINYNQLSDSLPIKWHGKINDILKNHVQISVDEFNQDIISRQWLIKFNDDPLKALDDYWSDLIKGISKILGGDYINVIR